MNDNSLDILVKMGMELTTLAVKGTTTAIHSKIESVKNEKNADTLRNTYDEIINQVLSEREEAIRIAKVYKEELDKVVISDNDIKHLHNTITKVLEILPQNEPVESLAQIKELISIDVLKTMQLLGFNYKAAIGEPLTVLCADAIKSKLSNKKNVNKR